MCRRLGPTPGLFEWGLLPLDLFDMGTMDVTGVRFDVSGVALLRGGDLVCVISRLMMSDDMGDRDWFPSDCEILGLSPRLWKTSYRRPTPQQSSPRKRCQGCIRLRLAGGDRSCQCRYHYHVSPPSLSRSHLRS